MNPKIKLAGAALSGVIATLVAGGIAFAAIGHSPMGHFRGADADKNGEITRAEWLKAASASFDEIDSNKDGKLVVGEIPPERHGGPDGPGGPGRHGHHDFDDDRGPPPPADSDTDGNSVPLTPAPQPAK